MTAISVEGAGSTITIIYYIIAAVLLPLPMIIIIDYSGIMIWCKVVATVSYY